MNRTINLLFIAIQLDLRSGICTVVENMTICCSLFSTRKINSNLENNVILETS